MNSEVTLFTYLLAGVIAFGLGSIPVAYTVGRLNGVNVFKVGSRQAGATNVWRQVSRKHGFIVTLIDWAKGLTAILMARHIGLESSELLLPATAAVVGHWNSPFTKFKGGDGVVTLMGASMGIAPLAVLLSLMIGTTLSFSMNRKVAHPSLWGGILGYVVFITISFQSSSGIEPYLVYGLTGIGVAIMLHSIYFHKRHKEYFRNVPQDEQSENGFREDLIS